MVIIDFSRTKILRECQRLAKGSRADRRRLLRIGSAAEFQNLSPVLVNGKLDALLLADSTPTAH
jgi:hypothetical protein